MSAIVASLGWWIEVWDFSKKHIIPDVFIKRKFNFITIHYCYMIGMTLLGSIVIIGVGDMAYIDALFFASGACTQSGLNTIDVNMIHLSQQVMLYIGAMMCNPIIVHSVVVFVRLYWFEKRFKDVVRDARMLRRTKSRQRNTTKEKDPEFGAEEPLGVRGRAIQILRHTGRKGKKSEPDQVEEKEEGKPLESSNTSDHQSDEAVDDGRHLRLKTTRSTEDVRLPQQLSPEQHIRFLENQRNPQDSVALRIPSPRDFERGSRPTNILESELASRKLRPVTSEPELPSTAERRKSADLTAAAESSSRNAGPTAHITIDEPQVLRERAKTTNFPRLNQRHTTQGSADFDSMYGPRVKKSTTLRSLNRSNTARTQEPPPPAPYLSWQPTIGRNSFFFDLTEEQREELGGIEYRALKTLAKVLMTYFFAFHILGAICLVPWIMLSGTYGPVVADAGVGRPWWGIFTAASAFNDLGFTLTADSMISFQNAVFPLLLMTFLIIIGNTGFPCMLRFVIWVASKCVTEGSPLWEELRFLLDHPRRCFTLLFPSNATWWLFGILIVLNGVDLIFFIILDLNDETVLALPPGIRFLCGLFQAAATRTAGFAVVNLADLHPAIQVSYLIMMYISVFPIAISMRRTNVYEEKSLGIYASPADDDEDTKDPSYVGAHLRRQLSFDLWYVFLGLFIIAIVEGGRIENTSQPAFTLFSILFEIVSAYGTVGLSLGYPTVNASFSSQFRTLSKLVIIAMQIRGRHRGLPYELDRAVLLPSESLQAKEAKEGHRIALRRRRSSAGQYSQMSAVDGVLEDHHFRTETGLSTGHHEPHDFNGEIPTLRVRTNTNRSTHSNHGADHHFGTHATGAAMHRIVSGIESIMEEPDREKERRD